MQKLQKTFHSRGSILMTSAAIFAATVLPLLLYLRRCSPFAAESVFQPDAFYYLTIARNSIHTKFYSFDGINPTNGFHPLWEFLLYEGMRLGVLNHGDPLVALRQIYIFNLLILGVAYGVLGAFWARHLQRLWLAFLAVCPGLLWFIVALTAPNNLANWSYLNGMESSVELLFFGLALLCFQEAPSTLFRLLVATFFFGCVVLSRLDDVFFLLPILVFVWRAHGEPRAKQIVAVSVPLAIIVAYITYNKFSVGVFMPTSGAIKAGVAISQNVKSLILLIEPIQWSQQVRGDSLYSETFMRMFQLLAPMIVCGVFLLRRARRSWTIIEVLCVGVLLKGAYNFCNVKLFNQGSWYFASSVFTANFILGLEWDLAMNPASSKRMWARSLTAALACTVTIALCFNIYANHLVANGGGIYQTNILMQSQRLQAMVRDEGSDCFIDMSDGELSYATGMKTMSGQGLVLDPVASDALMRGHLFNVASDRKCLLMMASGGYRDMIDDFIKKRRRGDPTKIFTISGTEFDHFDVVSVSREPITDTSLYRISPKP